MSFPCYSARRIQKPYAMPRLTSIPVYRIVWSPMKKPSLSSR
ncbi:hypothetical protein SDJN02_01529, partial [Cucurbita argyrosperma subsp. argyrosperma]